MSDTVDVVVPSARVPGGPEFAVTVPSSWTPGPAAGLVASFAVDREPDWSVVMSTMRIDAETTLRDVAVRTFARQRAQHPSAVIRTQRTGRFDGRVTYLREVALPDEAVGIAQLQALFVVPVTAVPALRDVVSVVATCPDGSLHLLGPDVIDLVASFRSAAS